MVGNAVLNLQLSIVNNLGDLVEQFGGDEPLLNAHGRGRLDRERHDALEENIARHMLEDVDERFEPVDDG